MPRNISSVFMGRNDFLEAAAYKVIVSYLRIIQHSVPQVINLQNKKFEALHDLRVYSRRLRNALWIFRDIFPKRLLKRWKKYIRDVARDTSLARDLDVHIFYLENYGRKLKNEKDPREVGRLLESLKSKRAQAQPSLRRSIQSLQRAKVLEEIHDLLRTAKREKKSFAEISFLFKKKISKLLRRFLEYEKYVYQPQRSEELHRMRIAAKHVRYTLECFQPILKGRISNLLKHIISFHRLLGEIHDLDVRTSSILLAERQTRALTLADRKAIDHLILHCQKLRERNYHRFVAAWEKAKKENVWGRLKNL